MGSCAAPSAKGDDKFITTDYLQQCPFKEVKVFLEPKYKAMLMQMCNEDGLTQAEVLTALIKSEAQKRCM
ncbi:RepB family protein [Escherichia coli]|uniref:RepB family protein n=1 Tax=Escherichia coli TaxID=562 RepID=UPI0035D4A2F3